MISKRALSWALTVVMAVIGAVPTVAAEDLEPLTWVNHFKPLPGKGRDAAAVIQKYDAPVLDQLQADGVIMSWGMGFQMVAGSGPAHEMVMWATFDRWGRVGAIEAAFEKARGGMKAEERAAMMEEYLAVMAPDTERTEVLRHIVFHAAEPEVNGKYLLLSTYKAKHGKAREMVAAFKEFAGPVFDGLVADGTVAGYGMYVADIHGDNDWSHVVWTMMPDLSAMDAVDAAFAADRSSRSEAMNEAISAAFDACSEHGHHQDILIRILDGPGGDS